MRFQRPGWDQTGIEQQLFSFPLLRSLLQILPAPCRCRKYSESCLPGKKHYTIVLRCRYGTGRLSFNVSWARPGHLTMYSCAPALVGGCFHFGWTYEQKSLLTSELSTAGSLPFPIKKKERVCLLSLSKKEESAFFHEKYQTFLSRIHRI